MLVLGVDPGTALTGYGLVAKDGNRIVSMAYGVIKTSNQLDLSKRLLKIHLELDQIISQYQPDFLAVEELFFNRNAKTFFAVSQARGTVVLTGALREIEVFEYTPLQVKQAVVGYGRADKHQVQEMVRRILGLEQPVKPDDVADALAIAICHINSYRLGREMF